MEDRIGQLILEKIKTLAIQKVIVLSAIDRGSGAFRSIGLQSNGMLVSVEQKEKWAKKMKRYKEREF